MGRFIEIISGVLAGSFTVVVYLSFLFLVIYIGQHGVAPYTNETVGIGFSAVCAFLLGAYELLSFEAYMKEMEEEGEDK